MKKLIFFGASIIGGLLLWAAWPVSPLTFIIFFALLPLHWLADNVKNNWAFFGYCYLQVFLWNIFTTWWIWNASLPGALSAFFLNSLIMCVPWMLYRFTKKKLGESIGYFSLAAYWLSFEFMHYHWQLNWPWLTLGNVFANRTSWVQWYEILGTSGGSLWILLVNIFIYQVYTSYKKYGAARLFRFKLIIALGSLIVPLIFSIVWAKRSAIINEENEALNQASKNVVIVQPNIDPYIEKFTGSAEGQINNLISLSEKEIDANTRLVIWPETAVPVQVMENSLKNNFFYYPIYAFLKRHPQTHLLTGAESYKLYGANKDSASPTARLEPNTQMWYDAFNTAAFIDADTAIDLYHKSKLVPGIESIPDVLKFISSWFNKFGGIGGSLGKDKERKVFITNDKTYRVAPIICYESIFGDYLTNYKRNGANLFAIITNDGWWGNTPGYKQHMAYAQLRALETRTWIVRSANTGISAVIAPSGKTLEIRPWDNRAAIKHNIPSAYYETFFVKFGDIISRIALTLTVTIFFILIFGTIKAKFK